MPDPNPHLRRNLTLGIINGVFFNLALAFLSGATIIPLFVSGLTGSSVLIGIFSGLEDFCWYLPQLFGGALIIGRPLVLGFYNRLSLVRILLFSAVVISIFAINPTHPGLILLGFGLLFGLYSVASGFAGISFMEIVGKMIPTNKRGTLFGMRMFLGGLLAALAGPIVKIIIESRSFPVNFGYLYLLALLVIAFGLASFALVKERPKPLAGIGTSFKTNLIGGLAILRNNRNIRRLISARVLTNSYLLASPFYIIMATSHLGIPRPTAASYLSFEMIGYLGLNIVWARVSNKISNKFLLKLALLCALVPPVLAFYAYHHYPGYFVYGLVFFFAGAAISGTSMGYLNYLLEIVDEASRPVAIGLVHTLIAPTIFLSGLGGLIIKLLGYPALYVITAICLIYSLINILHLNEPTRAI